VLATEFMLLTPHTIVGITIGASVENPFLAFPLSIASHFAGDLFPHWDFFSNTKKDQRLSGWRPIAVMLDLMLALSLGLAAVLYSLWVLHNTFLAARIFACGVGSVLPDALELPYIYTNKDPLGFLTRIQRKLQVQAPLPWGILSQLGVIFVFSLILANSLK